VGLFNSADAFRDWRSNVRGALVKVATAEAEPDDAVAAAWDELLGTFDRVSDRRPRELHQHAIASLRLLARVGRAADVAPQELTTELLVAARGEMPTSRARHNLGRAVRRFEALRGHARFAPFMPPVPIGPLPSLRKARGAAYARLPRSVRDDFEAWLAGRPLARAPLYGRTMPLSKGYIGQLRSAVRWFVDRAERNGDLVPGSVASLSDLCRTDWLTEAITTEQSELSKPLKSGTLSTYVRRLLMLFADHGVDVAGCRLDPGLRRPGGLTPEHEDFCKKLLATRRLKKRFFEAPDVLADRGEAALAAGDHQRAIRAGIAAMLATLLIRVAPIRIYNLASIRTGGQNTTLFLDRRHDDGLLAIPASETKNHKPFKAPVPPGPKGSRRPRATIDWFIERIRPLLLARCGQGASEWLFPSTGGHLNCDSLRHAFQLEMSAIGLPMHPHLVRHAVASLMLDHEPKALPRVAALLGDEPATVLKHYAFIEKLRLVVEAQKTLLDSMARGVGKRS
jgi:integrase